MSANVGPKIAKNGGGQWKKQDVKGEEHSGVGRWFGWAVEGRGAHPGGTSICQDFIATPLPRAPQTYASKMAGTDLTRPTGALEGCPELKERMLFYLWNSPHAACRVCSIGLAARLFSWDSAVRHVD